MSVDHRTAPNFGNDDVQTHAQQIDDFFPNDCQKENKNQNKVALTFALPVRGQRMESEPIKPVKRCEPVVAACTKEKVGPAHPTRNKNKPAVPAVPTIPTIPTISTIETSLLPDLLPESLPKSGSLQVQPLRRSARIANQSERSSIQSRRHSQVPSQRRDNRPSRQCFSAKLPSDKSCHSTQSTSNCTCQPLLGTLGTLGSAVVNGQRRSLRLRLRV